MEVDRIRVIIFGTAGLDRKHIILKCLKRGKHKVNLLICSTRADITDEQSRDAVSLKNDMRMTSQEKYSRVARWLPWIIAVLVIADRKCVVWGQGVSGRVDLGGSRIIKEKNKAD